MSKTRSLISLDWVNFFVADVETGVGPFLSTYLSAVRHFNPAQIGTVIATQNLASVLSQVPAGWVVDGSRGKKWLLTFASVAVAGGSLAVAKLPSLTGQVVNQIVVGLAVTLIAPAIAAISLGIVGRNQLGPRIGRNEAYSHFGNILTALFAGVIGRALGQEWIFYVCALLGLASSLAALLIRNRDVDDNVARELHRDEKQSDDAVQSNKDGRSDAPAPLRDLWANRYVLIFAATVILFHISNAAMLPLAGQEIAKVAGKVSAQYMSACIVIAQCVMIPMAVFAGRLGNRVGRKTIFLIAFAALILRGVCFSVSAQPAHIVAIEALDGIGTGISGVLTVLVIADLAKGTGRFNLLQGMIRTALGIGAFVGNSLAGLAAKSLGFSATFVGLAAIAAVGFLIYAMFMPETADGALQIRNTPGAA